jgi:hypothetical protein
MPIVLQHSGSPGLKALGFQQVTVSTAALALSVRSLTSAQRAWITVETAAIRYRYDGLDPSTTVGHRLAAGGTLELLGSTSITQFKMIRDGATDATVAYTVEM